jgi:hypothetical protein
MRDENGDQCCGPTTFADAKAAAIAMSAGACGDYTVERQIAHLNGLQALIEDAALRNEGRWDPRPGNVTGGP